MAAGGAGGLCTRPPGSAPHGDVGDECYFRVQRCRATAHERTRRRECGSAPRPGGVRKSVGGEKAQTVAGNGTSRSRNLWPMLSRNSRAASPVHRGPFSVARRLAPRNLLGYWRYASGGCLLLEIAGAKFRAQLRLG